MDLDRTDFGIVTALQEDAALRLEEIGKRVGLAPSSVHERVRRLERTGVIRRWTVECDAEALGLGVLAFVGVRSSRPCADLVDALRALPPIEECHSVAGALSMLLKVRVASTGALQSLIESIRQIPGVDSTESTIVFTTQFERPFALPTAELPARSVRGRSRATRER